MNNSTKTYLVRGKWKVSVKKNNQTIYLLLCSIWSPEAPKTDSVKIHHISIVARNILKYFFNIVFPL